MNEGWEVSREEVKKLHNKLHEEAEASGYHLNPDTAFTQELVKGLLINEKRYGYWACPCRLASGKRDEDLDIICPCDYRDPDLTDYHACFCALYISTAVLKREKRIQSIPERRPPEEERKKSRFASQDPKILSLPLSVWRCRVCGYLCARKDPPEVCPICKAKRDRFERFI